MLLVGGFIIVQLQCALLCGCWMGRHKSLLLDIKSNVYQIKMLLYIYATVYFKSGKTTYLVPLASRITSNKCC